MTQQGGFTLPETGLAVAILAILSTLAIPTFLHYYQGAQLELAAKEVTAFLNQGRQLAIAQNQSVCVHITPTAMHYHLGTCAGAAWVAPGTDASGNIAVPTGISLATTADPVFSYLGAASPAATYAITHTPTGALLHVTVAASGRVSIGP